MKIILSNEETTIEFLNVKRAVQKKDGILIYYTNSITRFYSKKDYPNVEVIK